jgi:hypothetical protein
VVKRVPRNEDTLTRLILHNKWRILGFSLLLSLIIHSGVILYDLKLEIKEIEVKKKPLSMKFVQRAPRLVKPMELRKKPKIVQRKFVRPVAATKSFRPRTMRTAAVHGGTVLASLARPSDPVSRVMSLTPEEVALGPDLSSMTNVAVEKDDERESLDEQLLNAADLDIGKFNAMVVRDPKSGDLRGFFKMKLIKYDDQGYMDWRGNPGYNSEPLAMQHVSEYVELYTQIKIDIQSFITFDDPKLLKQPFIYLAGESGCPIRLNDFEIEGLRNYLMGGGFILVDDTGYWKGGPFDRRVREYLQKALGDKYQENIIPRDHPVYHALFDFDGPPMGSDMELGRYGQANRSAEKELDGIFIDGRLAVVISNKGYGVLWDLDKVFVESHGFQGLNLTRQFQFGVNMMVYALTHEGGIISKQLAYK